MPLTWLGQLSPTMQQQIALQRALLALQREDEEIRARTAEKAPALARRLGGGAQPSAAPAPRVTEPKEPTDWEAVADRRLMLQDRALATQLRAAKPTEGYVSGEERARLYREKMAGEKEELVGKAGEFWARIEPLDDAGEKVALDACRKYQPDLYRAMVEQGYVDKTTGIAVRPEQEATSVQYITADNGEMVALTTYPDGRIETEHTGVYPATEAEGAVGPTISETIALEKLGMEMGEYAERYRTQALKAMGDMPRPGIDTLTIDGKEVLATAEHANAWLEGVNALTAYLAGEAGEAPVEGEVTMDSVKSMYEGRPDLISDVQQKLGIPITGVWDEATEFAFTTYGETLLTEESIGAKKPSYGKGPGQVDWYATHPEAAKSQKEFWDKWAKVFKIPEGIIKAVKGVR